MRNQTEYPDFIHPIDRKELISKKYIPNLFINLTIQKIHKNP